MRRATAGLTAVLAVLVVVAAGCPSDMTNRGGVVRVWADGKQGTVCNVVIRKFHDLNMNGELEEGEPEIGTAELLDGEGWPVYFSDADGVEYEGRTPLWCVDAVVPGVWTFWEGEVEGWVATGAFVNWEPVDEFSSPIEITITGEGEENYEIIFLNAMEEALPPECNLTIRKYNDLNMNGLLDEGEPEIGVTEFTDDSGWPVYYTDPTGAEFSDFTPSCIVAELLGTWTVWEGSVGGWVQTAALVNGLPVANFAAPIEVEFTGDCAENYEIVFLNAVTETPPECNLVIRKFNDLNMNGMLDDEEPEIGVTELVNDNGWPVYVSDPNGAQQNLTTPACILADLSGVWTVWEGEVEGWFATGVLVNGAPVENLMAPIEVEFTGACEEFFEIIFLNSVVEEPQTGSVCAYKVYDAGRDGLTEDDGPIEGFKLCLLGCDYEGHEVGPLCKFTDANGAACWEGLAPGFYVVCEVLPDYQWFATTPPCAEFELGPGEYRELFFANYCAHKVTMYSKGWWHNKHGCRAVTLNPELLEFLNSLPPFMEGFVCTRGNCNDCYDGDHDWDCDDDCDCDCNCYCHDDDECGYDFEKKKGKGNGKGPKGDCGNRGKGHGEGNGRDERNSGRCDGIFLPFDDCCELSAYLVAPNNQDWRLGLSQQLAAFVLNCLYQTGGLDLHFPKLDMTAQEVVDAVVFAWETGWNVKYWQTILDRLNNAKVIYLVSPEPCPVVYCKPPIYPCCN